MDESLNYLDVGVRLLTSVSLIVAICTAILGFRRWKIDLTAKQKIQLCEDVLALAYEVRDAINTMRDPSSTGYEGQSAPEVAGESAEERDLRREAHIYLERFERQRDVIQAFNKIRYRFMAVYGEHWANPFQTLVGTVNRVLVAVKENWRDRPKQIHGRRGQELEERALVRRQRRDEIIMRGYADDDKVQRDIDIAVEQLAAKCREEISANSEVLYGITRTWRKWMS